MKLKTVKGQWILTDGEREINFKGCGLAAWDYVLTMRDIRDLPKVPRQVYPVRLSAKWKRKIKTIKHNYRIGVYGECSTKDLR